MTLNFIQKAIGFSVQINVTSKKKEKDLYWNWDGFFVRNKVTSEKKKGLHWNWDGLINIKLPKILTETCPKNMKLPKILMQYCLNNMKLPETSTLWNQAGGPVPPRTPTYTPLIAVHTVIQTIECLNALFWIKMHLTSQWDIYYVLTQHLAKKLKREFLTRVWRDGWEISFCLRSVLLVNVFLRAKMAFTS